MCRQNWHEVIIAYRLEDKNGNSPFIISTLQNHFPENIYPDYEDYRYAFIHIDKFLDPSYYTFYKDDNYFLYEYVLRSCLCFTNSEGAVSFRSGAIISKTILIKGMMLWQEE